MKKSEMQTLMAQMTATIAAGMVAAPGQVPMSKKQAGRIAVDSMQLTGQILAMVGLQNPYAKGAAKQG